MRVLLLFEPDEECVDPLDEARAPRRHYDSVEPNADAIVMWREYGDQFKGGFRTHMLGGGIFENVSVKGGKKALRKLLAL